MIMMKFDHTNKGYMHNLESVLENETHKHLWDFEIKTDHLMSARQPDLVIININNNNKKLELDELWIWLFGLTTE